MKGVNSDETPDLWLAQDADADQLLARDPFALLIGMILDQQIPLERAFSAPFRLRQRLGDKLSVELVADMDPDVLKTAFCKVPALHRFPAANAERVQKAANIIVEHYDGKAENIWLSAKTGDQLIKNIAALPGFGKTKAQIFAALLAKQFGVKPRGWQTATDPFGKRGVFMSVADIVDESSWQKTREYKKAIKAAAKAGTT